MTENAVKQLFKTIGICFVVGVCTFILLNAVLDFWISENLEKRAIYSGDVSVNSDRVLEIDASPDKSKVGWRNNYSANSLHWADKLGVLPGDIEKIIQSNGGIPISLIREFSKLKDMTMYSPWMKLYLQKIEHDAREPRYNEFWAAKLGVRPEDIDSINAQYGGIPIFVIQSYARINFANMGSQAFQKIMIEQVEGKNKLSYKAFWAAKLDVPEQTIDATIKEFGGIPLFVAESLSGVNR